MTAVESMAACMGALVGQPHMGQHSPPADVTLRQRNAAMLMDGTKAANTVGSRAVHHDVL